MYSNKKLAAFKSFVAIDFETANRNKNSACAVGLIRVENNIIVKKKSILIRPVSTFFEFTDIHGLTWNDVKSAPVFGDIWPQIRDFVDGADFMAAHNASFDKRVLKDCCQYYGTEDIDLPFICTVKLSRDVWKLYPTKLPDVCTFLNLTLKHHDPLSDAEACANIVISAIQDIAKASN
ncbi:MAG: 3'-5' exonuclease [Spirochaetia bacterium]|nr:3'-5' exonuclease [Spirochaetia bacterium]